MIQEIRVGQIQGRPTRPKIRVGLVLHVLHGSGAYAFQWCIVLRCYRVVFLRCGVKQWWGGENKLFSS